MKILGILLAVIFAMTLPKVKNFSGVWELDPFKD